MGIDQAMRDDQELSIYAGSDGSLRTGWTMWNEGKGRRWKPVMWDNDAGWTLRWDRMTEELVWYVPITLSELPAWVAIRRNERGTPTRVIDTREEDR